MLTALPLASGSMELGGTPSTPSCYKRTSPTRSCGIFLYVLVPMAFGGLSIYACFHSIHMVGLLVGLALVAAIVVSRLDSDRRLARATLLLAAGYAHTPLVYGRGVLLWVGGSTNSVFWRRCGRAPTAFCMSRFHLVCGWRCRRLSSRLLLLVRGATAVSL